MRFVTVLRDPKAKPRHPSSRAEGSGRPSCARMHPIHRGSRTGTASVVGEADRIQTLGAQQENSGLVSGHRFGDAVSASKSDTPLRMRLTTRFRTTRWNGMLENPAPEGQTSLAQRFQRWEKCKIMIQVPEGRPSSHARSLGTGQRKSAFSAASLSAPL